MYIDDLVLLFYPARRSSDDQGVGGVTVDRLYKGL